MSPRTNSPCKDCTRRHELCHATCPNYAEWCDANEAYKKKVREIKQCEIDVSALIIKRAKRIRQAAERAKKLGGTGNGKKAD